MMRPATILTTLCLLLTFTLSAQRERVNPTPNRASDPRTYLLDLPDSEAAQYWDASFPEKNVGFLHVYADPGVEAGEVYSMMGREIDGISTAMLPKKFQKMASRMDADVYASAAIRGKNENLYLVRMDGPSEDRVEMFALRGGQVKHLKTLAHYKKSNSGRVKQTDSWLTDIDGDTHFELMTITRSPSGKEKRSVYMMDDKRKWVKTSNDDAPWNSADLFDPAMDKE